MANLIRRGTAANTSAASAPASKTTRTAATTARGGAKKFEFQYKARSAEDVKQRAQRSVGGRDSYVSQDVQFFTARDGQNTIRILPPPSEKADAWKHYGISVFVHRNIGADKGSYICAAKMGLGECAVCDARADAVAQGETDLADDLRPGENVLIYVIDRSQESKGVLLWNISAVRDKNITGMSTDPSSGEVYVPDDPDNGYDFSFTRTGTGLKTKYSAESFARRASALHDNPDEAGRWLQYITEHPLDKLLIIQPYEHVQKVLDGQAPGGQASNYAAKDTAGAPESTRADPTSPPAVGRQLARRTTAAVRTPAPEPAPQEEAAAVPEGAPTLEDINGMEEEDLAGVLEEFKLEFPTAEMGSIDELRDYVAEQLGLIVAAAEAPPEPEPAPAAKTGNWRDRLAGKK